MYVAVRAKLAVNFDDETQRSLPASPPYVNQSDLQYAWTQIDRFIIQYNDNYGNRGENKKQSSGQTL